MNQVIDSLQRKCSDDSVGAGPPAREDRSQSASTGSVENCRLDMVGHETWRSPPPLSWNLPGQTLQGEGSPTSRLEVCEWNWQPGQSRERPPLQGPRQSDGSRQLLTLQRTRPPCVHRTPRPFPAVRTQSW